MYQFLWKLVIERVWYKCLYNRLYCRYKAVERIAAEEFERERPRVPTRGRTEITLCLSPNPASRSASRCTTPSTVISQEDTVATAHQTLGKWCLLTIYTSLVPKWYEHGWTEMYNVMLANLAETIVAVSAPVTKIRLGITCYYRTEIWFSGISVEKGYWEWLLDSINTYRMSKWNKDIVGK